MLPRMNRFAIRIKPSWGWWDHDISTVGLRNHIKSEEKQYVAQTSKNITKAPSHHVVTSGASGNKHKGTKMKQQTNRLALCTASYPITKHTKSCQAVLHGHWTGLAVYHTIPDQSYRNAALSSARETDILDAAA